ncbi:MAG: DUF58 domain-containing protein [Acidobacteriota bacterium]|nr:DUF58 domain-containing protein [Acidobacteriota bacterium]
MLTGRGLFLVASSLLLVLAGLAYGVEEFLLVAVATGALLACGGLALWRGVPSARRGLRLEVDRPVRDLYVDGGGSIGLLLSNAGRRPLAALWLDGGRDWRVTFPGFAGTIRDLAPPPEGPRARRRRRLRQAVGLGPDLAGAVGVGALAGHGLVRLPVDVPSSSRGLWSLAPVTLWCTDPLRLVAWRVARTDAVHVVVVPRPTPPGGPPGSDPGSRPDHHAAAPASASGGGDEFAGLRPYVPGDRLTRLHWPALARTDELMSRSFVEVHRLQIVVDTRPWEIESSVSHAAGTGIAALEAGTPVELRTSGGDEIVVSPGPMGRSALLRALALVAPVGARDGTRSLRPAPVPAAPGGAWRP